MNRYLLLAALLLGAPSPSVEADDKPPKTAPKAVVSRGLPSGLRNFNGLLVGRLAEKDVEKGTLRLTVDRVSRVWRNSKATDPKSVVGKTVVIEGVFGKWLDVLLLLKTGETLELESRHDGGDHLTFPGELLRKVAPVKPGDYPELPEAFRGFHGVVACAIVRKDVELLEMLVEVSEVKETWEKSRAKKPESIVGKRFLLAGFWKHKELYHGLEKGDEIETGVRHISLRSDHLSMDGFIGKDDLGDLPRGIRRFSGMIVGRLRSKDLEKGTFSVEVDRVARVWRNNKAPRPKSILKKAVPIEGVTGKWLDVLLTAKVGETLALECQHHGGPTLRFIPEGLRRVAPVKPGDYPALPDSARGFRGELEGMIVQKDEASLELVLEVRVVGQLGKENRARKAADLVGKRVMLGGFWHHKEQFKELRVGDRIATGIRHSSWHTDHLTITAPPREVAPEAERQKVEL